MQWKDFCTDVTEGRRNELTNRKVVYCSLKDMFNSTQFEGAFANFQQLVSEGMFDSAEVGLNHRVLQHFQQLLNITDLSGSGWIERCFQLQHRSKRGGKPADFSKVLAWYHLHDMSQLPWWTNFPVIFGSLSAKFN